MVLMLTASPGTYKRLSTPSRAACFIASNRLTQVNDLSS